MNYETWLLLPANKTVFKLPKYASILGTNRDGELIKGFEPYFVVGNPFINHINHITVLIYEIFLRKPRNISLFLHLFTLPLGLCCYSHPATLQYTKFPAHIQGKSMTICQAYTNYIIFNEIELLLKNPYITALPY